MEYKLMWCLGEGKRVETIIDPFFEDIANAISSLLPIMYNFVILEHPGHSGGNTYIQTMMTDNPDDKVEQEQYLVEAHFEKSEDGKSSVYRQFKTYFDNREDVLRLFGTFYSGEPIDVRGWLDVTEKVKATAMKSARSERRGAQTGE